MHDAERLKMLRETEAFREQHAGLWARYAEQYIAMLDGRVIDHDTNQVALVERIDEQYPDTPVLITRVAREPIEVYKLSRAVLGAMPIP